MEYSILLGVALLFGSTPITTPMYSADFAHLEVKEMMIELPIIEPIVVEIEKVEHPEVPVNNNVACSCVKTAREVYGVQIPFNHNAWDLSPNITEAEVGQLVLMQYPTIGHVAVVDAVTEEGYLISEGNYNTCQFTTRFIPKDYYAIVGFWSDGTANSQDLAYMDI